jgi:chemotaxis protein CheZ
MAPIKSSRDIASCLALAERTGSGTLQLGTVQESVGNLLKDWPREQGLYAQLKRLAEFIDTTKSEIAALKPVEVSTTFIPTATDELDAIVEATATATNRIMDAAEQLMMLTAGADSAVADSAMTAITSIFEACTFQDITGQRITKVVKTLKVIQERLGQMIQAEGAEVQPAAAQPSTPPPQGDAALLNGPALPGNGQNQAEIDALLASFD